MPPGGRLARRVAPAATGRLALVRVERAAPAELRLLTGCLLGTVTPRRVLGIEAFRRCVETRLPT